MKEFKYDVELLITSVKNHPCLWDKTLDVYKEKAERRKAWEEIFNVLEPQYEMMPLEDQQSTGEHIISKWTNVRDTFVKSLKHRQGKPRRRYIFYSLLKFLIKTVKPDKASAEQSQEQSNHNDVEADLGESQPYLTEITYEEPETVPVPKKRTKRYERSDDSYTPDVMSSSAAQPQKNRKRSKRKVEEDIDFVEVNETPNREELSDPRLMNEDEAFFASLLPTVVKYNEDERLEFRIEVLKVIKNIKNQRKWKIESE